MRIIFYTQGTPFDGSTLARRPLGGSESALAYVARSLHRAGAEVSVFNNCDRPGVYEGIHYAPTDGLCLETSKADVVVMSRFCDIAPQVQARLRILWLHDVAATPYYARALPVMDRHISAYFFISKWQMHGFLEAYNLASDKCFLTTNGVDPTLFADSGDRDPFRLVYINTPNRGLDVLVTLFPSIRRAVPEATLHVYASMLIYGDQATPDEQAMQPVYELASRTEGITLYSPLTKAELAHALMQSRLALYPSHFTECCSIASLEAQAAGTPMITSDLAGLRDTIQHGMTGILVPIDDPAKRSYSHRYQSRFLNETIRLLKDDAQWQRLSQTGRERILNGFSWDRIARCWLDEFDKLLAATP